MTSNRHQARSRVAQLAQFWNTLNVNIVKQQGAIKNYKRGRYFTALKLAWISRVLQ